MICFIYCVNRSVKRRKLKYRSVENDNEKGPIEASCLCTKRCIWSLELCEQYTRAIKLQIVTFLSMV